MAGTVQPFVDLGPTPFETGASSHVGKVRTRNEDSYLVQPQSGVWAVADGMGGHDDGDVASEAVIAQLRGIGRPGSAAELLARCEEGVVAANARLLALAEERGGGLIGTTVAILLTHGVHYACLWCGDSRVYRLRDGELTQISHDHTEVQEMVDTGRLTPEEARTWPGRNVITRAIGVHDEPELELQHGALEPGDIFLICSDGLTGHLSDEEIRAELASRDVCQEACDALIETTLERGARDNVTVVAVRYRPDGGNGADEPEPAESEEPPPDGAQDSSAEAAALLDRAPESGRTAEA
jgi:protein phosphatase